MIEMCLKDWRGIGKKNLSCNSFLILSDSFGGEGCAEDSGWELEDVVIVSDVSGSIPN